MRRRQQQHERSARLANPEAHNSSDIATNEAQLPDRPPLATTSRNKTKSDTTDKTNTHRRKEAHINNNNLLVQ